MLNLLIKIYTFKNGINLEAEFRNSANPAYRELADRFDPYLDMEAAFAQADAGQLVMGETKNLHEYTMRKRFTNKYVESFRKL